MNNGVGEEAAQTVLSVTSKAAIMTLDIIFDVIRNLSNQLKTSNKGATKTEIQKTGKQSLKSLSAQNVALDNIPVTNVDIKAMTAKLKEYGIDFSVVKNRATKDFTLFFKGTDTAAITNALEQIATESEEKATNKTDKEEKKPLDKQKQEAKEKADKQNAEKAADKAKEQQKRKEQEQSR